MGVRCAVVDTGILPNPRVGRVVARRSFVEGEPVDQNGHGTGVASVVCSVAPSVELVDAHALDGSGASTFSRILEALEFAVLDAEADVVNMSFGSFIPFPPAEELFSEIRSRGVSLVAAAGNSGPGFLTVGFPAASNLVVAVGGVAVRSPREGAVSEFSSRGPSIDGKIKPDICGASGTLSEGLLTAWLDGERVVRGTSFSSPQVAGAECILRQAFHGLKPDFYDGKLFASARDIELSGKDVTSGFGVMDVGSALKEQPRSAHPAVQELLIGFFSSLLPK